MELAIMPEKILEALDAKNREKRISNIEQGMSSFEVKIDYLVNVEPALF
jgi:hypothetical protein